MSIFSVLLLQLANKDFRRHSVVVLRSLKRYLVPVLEGRILFFVAAAEKNINCIAEEDRIQGNEVCIVNQNNAARKRF